MKPKPLSPARNMSIRQLYKLLRKVNDKNERHIMDNEPLVDDLRLRKRRKQ